MGGERVELGSQPEMQDTRSRDGTDCTVESHKYMWLKRHLLSCGGHTEPEPPHVCDPSPQNQRGPTLQRKRDSALRAQARIPDRGIPASYRTHPSSPEVWTPTLGWNTSLAVLTRLLQSDIVWVRDFERCWQSKQLPERVVYPSIINLELVCTHCRKWCVELRAELNWHSLPEYGWFGKQQRLGKAVSLAVNEGVGCPTLSEYGRVVAGSFAPRNWLHQYSVPDANPPILGYEDGHPIGYS